MNWYFFIRQWRVDGEWKGLLRRTMYHSNIRYTERMNHSEDMLRKSKSQRQQTLFFAEWSGFYSPEYWSMIARELKIIEEFHLFECRYRNLFTFHWKPRIGTQVYKSQSGTRNARTSSENSKELGCSKLKWILKDD